MMYRNIGMFMNLLQADLQQHIEIRNYNVGYFFGITKITWTSLHGAHLYTSGETF